MPFLSSSCSPTGPNGQAGPVNKNLEEYELPNQEDVPMVVPKKAGDGDRSPSPDYVSPMDEQEGARSRSPEQEDQEDQE